MSDQVQFIVGNQLDRDHYPLATTLADPMDATIYPLKLSRDIISKWYMQVKTWSLTGTFEMAGTVSTGGNLGLTGSYNLLAPSVCHHVGDLGSLFVSTRERDLIPDLNQGAQIVATISSPSGIGGTSYTNSSPVFSLGIGSGTMTMSLTCSGGISPPFHLDLGAIIVSFFLQFPVGWNTTEGPAPKIVVTASMLVTMTRGVGLGDFSLQVACDSKGSFGPTIEPDSIVDGQNLPMKSLVNPTPGNLTMDSHTISPVIITPVEFWPYV